MIHTLRNRSCSGFIKQQSPVFTLRIIIGKQQQQQQQQQSLRLNVTSSVNSYPDHYLVYKYPLVRVASLINRLKFYQTFVTLAGIPAASLLAAADVITVDTALLYLYSGIIWCLPLYTIGFLGTNRVGFIHLRDDKKSVKISYANFWGRRIVVDVPIDDLWPLNDLPDTNPFYYSLRRFSNKDTLKFNIKNGIVADEDKFRIVFGGSLDGKK